MIKKLALVLVLLNQVAPAHAAPIYQFPVTGCEVNFARAHHDYAASDILAKAGCKFVAPIDGVIDEVSRIDMEWQSEFGNYSRRPISVFNWF